MMNSFIVMRLIVYKKKERIRESYIDDANKQASA
jgi:hypothetical protein